MARNVIRAYCNCLESYFGETNVMNPIIEKPNVWSPIIANFSKLAVRQFAIKKEFHLGVEKSCKKRYRAYCKSGDEMTGPCPWKINGNKLDGCATVEVNNFLYDFIHCSCYVN